VDKARLGTWDQADVPQAGNRTDLARQRFPHVLALAYPPRQAWQAERLAPRLRLEGFKLTYYGRRMLRYHIAFYLPNAPGEMVVAEALDFPGAMTQGFDLPDARLMIASALEDLAQMLLEEGRPLPVPSKEAHRQDADLMELMPLSIHAGTLSR